MDHYYEYRHVVDFAETGQAGDVFPVSYPRWQGRCWEMFLLEHAPGILDRLCADLELVTIRARCDYLAGVQAFDGVSVRMRVEELSPATIGFVYDHVRIRGGNERLAARGQEMVTCVCTTDMTSMPDPVPDELRLALGHYATSGSQRMCSARLGVGGRA